MNFMRVFLVHLVKLKTYIKSRKEINDQDTKFKIGHIVKILNTKIYLQMAMLQIGLKKFL